jgi:signal transduction histidine kinase
MINRLKNLLKRQSLQSNLIFWFLLISLLPLAWMTFISYEFSRTLLLSQAKQNLRAISLRQTQLIDNYFQEREKIILSFANGVTAPLTMQRYQEAFINGGIHSPEYETVDRQFRQILRFQTKTLGYANWFFVTTEGTIIFSSFSSPLLGVNLLSPAYQNSSLYEIFKHTRDFLEVQLSNFTYFSSDALPTTFVAAPILNQQILTGIMIAQLDNQEIYNLTNDYSGLGKTGESLLVTRIDGELVSIAPLRGEISADPTRLILADTPFGKFVSKTLKGQRLIDTLIDYQGQHTLVVGRYFLPSLSWGMITKMDMNELLAPINRLRWLSIIMSLATAGIVILTASNVAASIAHPILKFTHTTKQMAAGDFSQQIEIESDNEMGRLGQSFNDMAVQLNNMVKHLDTLVEIRTKEVENKNKELEKTIDELREAQNRLINQEKLASLGALTAGIAHEIKNPLNFINNFSELSLQLEEELHHELSKIKSYIPEKETKEIEEILKTLKLNISKIYEHGQRADSIVYNMLRHSRGAPGDKIPTDINLLLDQYISLSYHGMRAQNPGFNVKIEKNYDPSIPKVPLISQEISRVLLNLLSNAYYSVNQKKNESGPDYVPIVRITTKNHVDLVVIKIWDNGKGIPIHVFPKLFTPFFTTKPTGEGTGLGLSLSYNIIVHGHGGTLVVDSESGEFAEFIIGLPTGIKKKI